jgi:hypothetical protein
VTFSVKKKSILPSTDTSDCPVGTGGALSLRIKRSDREADHSHPSSAEVKECMELSPVGVRGVVLS